METGPEELHREGRFSDESMQRINRIDSVRLFSLHWEIKTVLYIGILLLSGGLSILVYENIDTIGHQIILFIIAVICSGCFVYCFKKKFPYSNAKVLSPDSFFDYILLLGCLTLITFIGYLQFQYHVFDDRYGLATFIPMVALFFSAYYFDHVGVLAMAITSLAAWSGIAVTPTRILQDNDFNSTTIIITGVVLGSVLICAGSFSLNKKIKSHFEFSYTNSGAHLLFISSLAAIFHFNEVYIILFLVVASICYFFYRKAIGEKSFYYLLIASLYFYIGLSYTFISLFISASSMGGIYLTFVYFIASAIGLLFFLIKMNKKIKTL